MVVHADKQAKGNIIHVCPVGRIEGYDITKECVLQLAIPFAHIRLLILPSLSASARYVKCRSFEPKLRKHFHSLPQIILGLIMANFPTQVPYVSFYEWHILHGSKETYHDTILPGLQCINQCACGDSQCIVCPNIGDGSGCAPHGVLLCTNH